MEGITELAVRIKALETSEYSPMIGKIISLPNLKIQLGNRVQLDSDDVMSIFDLYQTNTHDNCTEYVNLNKQVVLLPCSSKKFIAIGVIV